MALVTDVTSAPLSPLASINALMSKGPDWNYDTAALVNNTLYYTFSISSSNEAGRSGQQAFSSTQQAGAQAAFAYLQKITGINFVLTNNGAVADIHLCNVDLSDAQTTGECSWRASYTPGGQDGNVLVDYSANAWVYLDNREWRGQNANLSAGTSGYETLLHELGHALGLKHPFDVSAENGNTLPYSEDTTANTLMSYTHLGGPYPAYSQYDLEALAWLYGGDGLGGTLGLGDGTTGRYLMGTNIGDSITADGGNDMLEGDGGADVLNGGAGIDTAVFRGALAAYTVTTNDNGTVSVTDTRTTSGTFDGTDLLSNIEYLKFSDTTVAASQFGTRTVDGTAAADNFAPQAGNTVYNGSAGLDRVTYTAPHTNFKVVHTATGGYTVTDNVGNGGIDTLNNVERAYFSDHSAVALDVLGVSGLAYRMYKAAFDRAPDAVGLGYWIDVLDRGASADAVAQGFIDGSEFTQTWGANIGTEDFLKAMYTNLRHAAPDAEGLAFWKHVIDDVHMSRGYVLAHFATSDEMVAQVVGQVQDGIVYTPFG